MPIYLTVIVPFLSDSFESNAYLVVGDRCCVIDPGINPDNVLIHSREYNIIPDVLINTHCHFDHVGAVPELVKAGFSSVFTHIECAPALECGDDSLQLASLFGAEPIFCKVSRKLAGEDVIDVGGVILEVIHTPGHTRGSICLYEPESMSLITGDTVFKEGVGRTDLKGGSLAELEKSINALVGLVEERGVEKIYPGHGPVGCGEDIIRAYEEYFS